MSPLWLALTLLASAPVSADTQGDRPPDPGARVRLMVDGAVTAGAGLGWLALWLSHGELARPSCPCEASEVNSLDRPAVDFDWRHGERAADAVAAVSLALSLGGLAAVAPDRRTFAEDALLVAQSMAVTGLLTQGAKAAVSRPYPYMYGDPDPAQDRDAVNYASFWSGHTAVTMAGAVTFASIFHRRNPDSPWRWVVWVAAPALALGAGLFKISAGNHFPSDVATGAAVGAAVGYINPWLHEF